LATRNKFWFGNDEERVDVFLQLQDAGLGRAHAPLAFELERLGHHADREDAFLARGAGDDRGGAGAGATSHAGGDERMWQPARCALMSAIASSAAAAPMSGLEPAPRPSVTWCAHLNAALGARAQQRLGVGVGDDKLDAAQAEAIMLLTALPPAPPTPNTVIRGLSSVRSGTLRLIVIAAFFLDLSVCAFQPVRSCP
jgi:hypothetical protein